MKMFSFASSTPDLGNQKIPTVQGHLKLNINRVIEVLFCPKTVKHPLSKQQSSNNSGLIQSHLALFSCLVQLTKSRITNPNVAFHKLQWDNDYHGIHRTLFWQKEWDYQLILWQKWGVFVLIERKFPEFFKIQFFNCVFFGTPCTMGNIGKVACSFTSITLGIALKSAGPKVIEAEIFFWCFNWIPGEILTYLKKKSFSVAPKTPKLACHNDFFQKTRQSIFAPTVWWSMLCERA